MNIRQAWVRTALGGGLSRTENGEFQPSIFTTMSNIASATGAINLGQGFPDEPGPVFVLDAASDAIAAGHNQYPPSRGVAALRSAIARHQQRFSELSVDPTDEVLVTAGATEALAATLLAFIEPGDEVITFDPSYDAYGALIALAGGSRVSVPLSEDDFSIDHDALRAAVTARSRLIIVNDPHNPSGRTLSWADREEIVRIAREHDLLIVTDEVYEHLIFDSKPHEPIARHRGAWERTVSISSAGKTFSVTGWKVGWAVGPARHIAAIATIKQFLTFANAAPFQHAIARGLDATDDVYADIAAKLERRRDLLTSGLEAIGFGVNTPQAGYFVIADARPLGFTDAERLCAELPERAGVVGIPVTAFVRPEHRDRYASLVRFAFCKRTDVLEDALQELQRLGSA